MSNFSGTREKREPLLSSGLDVNGDYDLSRDVLRVGAALEPHAELRMQLIADFERHLTPEFLTACAARHDNRSWFNFMIGQACDRVADSSRRKK